MTSRRTRRLRPKGTGWVCAAAVALLALDTARVRQRLAALADISPSHEPPASPGSERRYRLLSAEGVQVPPESLAAAEAYADSHDLDVLELVPEDLDHERLLTFARWVDPASYRDDRIAAGRGAFQALLVEEGTLDRIGEPPAAPLSEADLVHLYREAKRCAPATTDIAVVAGVRAAPDRPDTRRAMLRAAGGRASHVVIWAPPLAATGVAAAALLSPGWGLAALAAYALEPVLALRGTGRAEAAPAPGFRLVTAPMRMARTLATRDPGPDPAADESGAQVREEWRKLLAEPRERLFEARRSTCPWCGGSALRTQAVCADYIQAKPGQFRLDRCLDCGHVFQNPRLSLEGLDFYYRDFYDGEGEDQLSLVFESGVGGYRSRADLALRTLSDPPGRWLDVGAGHGHFCLMAAQVFDTTRFEALDMADSVATAERRGWVARGHRGMFPDLAGELTEQFDVVSMFHYLEHSREPKDELAAARRVLRPGGHVIVEVPDPECISGRLLGRWWLPWLQPQHQHLAPLANLCRALEAEGFEVRAVQRAESHQGADVGGALFFLLNRLAPPLNQPWREPPSLWEKVVHGVVWALGAPPLIITLAASRLVAPLVGRLPRGSNAYRLIAQRVEDVSHD